MQKLITIYLNDCNVDRKKRDHGFIEEHVEKYLKEGWVIFHWRSPRMNQRNSPDY